MAQNILAPGDLPRANLERLIRENGDDFSSLSRFLGKNPAYIQQYIKRGTPRKLDEEDRRKLAEFYAVDEQLLGGGVASVSAPMSAVGTQDMVRIKQLQLGASAGPGSLADDEAPQDSMAFGAKWLKQIGTDPDKLSLIVVDGDSMDPTLCDGDDIMVDHSAAERPLRDGIYVLRMDDVLLVKRLALRPSGKLSIRSDNIRYPDWDDVEPQEVNIIGRVVWKGRRL
ncbi:S24 family peptidase [Parasphingorhabdus cellanae]|uniref:Helix-turn-helix transcriptional regulator n=1 Tax=Parasphingorhabdus cellanae TaxID=2806553 RepID=A0ABX7T355_9SPHN|nr:helix-turn-helix transcriptional regulator [Parasphingorhabdus cellanae]QTD55237.1 helix-turn-helix transcriptional regulator [Parasphingorhabdus cellanae]